MLDASERCQSCRRPAEPLALSYRKGAARLTHDSFLRCDVCERALCADCLQIYDILSGDDFLCTECARHLPTDAHGASGLRPLR